MSCELQSTRNLLLSKCELSLPFDLGQLQQLETANFSAIAQPHGIQLSVLKVHVSSNRQIVLILDYDATDANSTKQKTDFEEVMQADKLWILGTDKLVDANIVTTISPAYVLTTRDLYAQPTPTIPSYAQATPTSTSSAQPTPTIPSYAQQTPIKYSTPPSTRLLQLKPQKTVMLLQNRQDAQFLSLHNFYTPVQRQTGIFLMQLSTSISLIVLVIWVFALIRNKTVISSIAVSALQWLYLLSVSSATHFPPNLLQFL